MFDIGWSEMLVIALLALIIIGPKDLPKAMRTVGQWVRKARSLAREFQAGVDEMIRESELDEARKTLEATKRSNIGKTIREHVDPGGELSEEARSVEDAARKATQLEEPDESGASAAKPTDAKPSAAKPSAAKAKKGKAAAGGAKSRGEKGDTADKAEGDPAGAGPADAAPEDGKARVVKHPAKVAPGNSVRPPEDKSETATADAPSPSKAGGSAG